MWIRCDIILIPQRSKQNMQALKQNKQAHSHKFIIKPRGSLTHVKSEATEDPNLSSTQTEIDLFIAQLAQKGRKIKQTLQERDIAIDEFFCKQLQQSTCFKTMVRASLDRMLNDRRLGRGLKGLNKAILVEIQGHLWPTITRQVELFLNSQRLDREKEQLSNALARRKQQILQQLNLLREKKVSRDSAIEVVK